ncbi:probable F-box protein at4g22030 [Phtheirospermum japonicum]|uniref:Probable F-box protein at4g22030 n=1 Tax=Phtheirospermum japonicum TaxID=374723 RepID=A0A830CPA3_9LAMI|nr:probable F-box protein at4g22030 [Phtheirospermum japonicum]
MTTLKASSLILSTSISKPKRGTVRATINIPQRASGISLPGLPRRGLAEGQMSPFNINTVTRRNEDNSNNGPKPDPKVMSKLYAILEAVADRVEMHRNIGDQRDNWNSLLLTSINALTLAAATMAGIASVSGGGAPAGAMKLSSTVLYVAATGMLSIVNKIQPSQLAEEQRNAARLFKQLQSQIQTVVAIGNPTAVDVKEMMERVLAIDVAYPLPLIGAMLDKFPAQVEPAVWWPESRRKRQPKIGNNGWNGKLERGMRGIADVIRRKDEEEYLSLGGKMLKLNKFLAVSGPVLTGLAAVGSALVGSPYGGEWAVVVGVLGGALASVVNALEHGGQVGMVVEMYRSNAGFFKEMAEAIEGNLREEEPERRENGEVFEMKVGLQLGRSLSQLRGFADEAAAAAAAASDEFASKLF